MISCGSRLAPFDIAELREITAYDELGLDTLGDQKTALFLIMSDTDSTFNFLLAMIYSQLFNLLCEKADNKYGGRLPVHVRCLIDEAANIGQIPNVVHPFTGCPFFVYCLVTVGVPGNAGMEAQAGNGS